MAAQKQNQMPKPIRISRKLALASERLVVMTSPETTEPVVKCTLLRTGCLAHTC
jgi:hypothetical protein